MAKTRREFLTLTTTAFAGIGAASLDLGAAAGQTAAPAQMTGGRDPDLIVINAKVYTMDDLMRLPAVSRMHFIECGANTGMEWGNVAVPTVQYTHGMLSCCEFTGVPLATLLDDCGFDRTRGKFVLAEGAAG